MFDIIIASASADPEVVMIPIGFPWVLLFVAMIIMGIMVDLRMQDQLNLGKKGGGKK